jgi:hypothetical protein
VKTTKPMKTTNGTNQTRATKTKTRIITNTWKLRVTERFLHTATHVTGCEVWEGNDSVRFSTRSYPLKANGQTTMKAEEKDEVMSWLETIAHKYADVAKGMYFGEGSFGSGGDSICSCVLRLYESKFPAGECADGGN